MSSTTKGRLFTVYNDLLVHCLECDNTYRESEELSIAVRPHCNNPDPHRTVYVEENNDD